MSFQDFLDNLKQKASELKNEALKFKNKDFLNAAVSGSVLISMADGVVSSEEKQKMMRFIENYEALSVFSSKETDRSLSERDDSDRIRQGFGSKPRPMTRSAR